MATDDPQARVTELEIRNTFLEERVSALDEVLIAFTRRVERLESEMELLRARVSEMEPAPDMGGIPAGTANLSDTTDVETAEDGT